MRRTPQIAALAFAAATVLPQAATAQTPSELLAAATPLSDMPVPTDAPRLTDTPIASRDATLLADAGDAKQLLAQAPKVTATPPAASLPRTGPQLLLTLLTGGGLLLVGSGLRLRLRGARVVGATTASAGATAGLVGGTPGFGGAMTALAGAKPGLGGGMPGLVGATSGFGGAMTALAGATPGLGGAMPALAGATLGLGGAMPALAGATPAPAVDGSR